MVLALPTYLDHLRADVDRILAIPTDGLAAPVAACPKWDVADLVVHLADVQRYVTAQLLAPPGSELVHVEPPSAADDPIGLLAGAAERLLDAFGAVDPDEHRPNWAGAPTAAFWWRRMAQEAVVHRADVQLALGGLDPIDPGLAIDGVDELGDTFLRFAAPRGTTGAGETVHLHATDEGLADGTLTGGEWLFRFGPDGVDVTHEHAKGDMAARGLAQELLLFVWNRRPVELSCFGETDLLAWWPERVGI